MSLYYLICFLMIKNNNFLLFNDSLVLGYYFFAIIKKIQEVLGHSRIETPQIYTHIYNKNVEKAMLEHPLSKFKMQDALAFVV